MTKITENFTIVDKNLLRFVISGFFSFHEIRVLLAIALKCTHKGIVSFVDYSLNELSSDTNITRSKISKILDNLIKNSAIEKQYGPGKGVYGSNKNQYRIRVGVVPNLGTSVQFTPQTVPKLDPRLVPNLGDRVVPELGDRVVPELGDRVVPKLGYICALKPFLGRASGVRNNSLNNILNNLLNKAAGDYIDAHVHKQGKRIDLKRQWLEIINTYGIEIVCYAYDALSSVTYLDQVKEPINVIQYLKKQIESNLAFYQRNLALWKINEKSMISAIYSKFMDTFQNRHALDERTEILPELNTSEKEYLKFIGGWKAVWDEFCAYYLLECTSDDFYKKIKRNFSYAFKQSLGIADHPDDHDEKPSEELGQKLDELKKQRLAKAKFTLNQS